MPVLAVPKICTACNQPKTWFHADRRRKDGLQSQCRDCQLAANKARYHRKSAAEKSAIVARINARRDRRRYGLEPGQRELLLKAQQNRCALCGSADPGSAKGWHVDHCHETGQVRGILCKLCNHGLGHLGDSVEALERALHYLKTGPETVQTLLNE